MQERKLFSFFFMSLSFFVDKVVVCLHLMLIKIFSMALEPERKNCGQNWPQSNPTFTCVKTDSAEGLHAATAATPEGSRSMSKALGGLPLCLLFKSQILEIAGGETEHDFTNNVVRGVECSL